MGRQKKPIEEYASIAIRMDNFSARVGASINYEVNGTRFLDDETRVYEYDSCIDVSGVCSYPEEREGDNYHITVYGVQPGDKHLEARLKAYRVMGKDGFPKYRKVRGNEIAVYDVPKGIGVLRKVRGAKIWHGTIWVPEQTSSQMLTLLTSEPTIYIDIHERKVDRTRWIKGLSLQTTDPAEE